MVNGSVKIDALTSHSSGNLLSVVIPVFNTKTTLLELSQRIKKVFNELDYDFEVIFVDDCSTNPETWETLEKIAGNNIKAVQLTRNFGQHAATLCGMREAQGDYIITMDDDLQHLPEDIPKLLTYKNKDVVIASFSEKQHNLFKRVTSFLKKYIYQIIVGKQGVQFNTFRLMKRIIADHILEVQTPYPIIGALLCRITTDIINVPVTHGKRYEARSGYSLRKMFLLFSNLILSNSSILLRIVGGIGISMAFVSFMAVIYLIINKIWFGVSIIGWPATMAAISFFMGILLFTAGVIGEYLIRIIGGIEKTPLYCVRRII